MNHSYILLMHGKHAIWKNPPLSPKQQSYYCLYSPRQGLVTFFANRAAVDFLFKCRCSTPHMTYNLHSLAS